MTDANQWHGDNRLRPATPDLGEANRPRSVYEMSSGPVARDANPFEPFIQLWEMSPGFGGHDRFADPPVFAANGPSVEVGRQREIPLPHDATPTLFVEGLPANCSRREVSHIFRPFVGYMESRIVMKRPRHPGGHPLVLCFVDFESPSHATTALQSLQGYKFDEHEPDSAYLRLQFARNPGSKAGGRSRGKH